LGLTRSPCLNPYIPKDAGFDGLSEPTGGSYDPVASKAQHRKVTYFPWARLAFFSNRCLNSNCPFKTESLAMAKRLLTAGLVAVGLTGFVMASQWGYAAEPPAYPVPASPEMMQLVRDEHDLVADMIKAQLVAERDRYAEQRTAISATPSAVGPASVPRTPSSVRGRRNS
jgi:hypothetical protein